ncbi:SCO family protein [Halomonas sp. 1513]|nr:SCO family protein [Halomonas sp. 1513]APX91614.1 SCO family protein [Halomonas sp. 1513]
MTRKMRWAGIATLVLVVALGTIWWVQQHGDDGEPRGGEVALPSTQGEFSLAAMDDDELAVLFFGYTYCPDICPMTLAVIRQALQQLEPEHAERLVPVLITVDPARDTLERLEEYVGYFGEQFIGARGSEEQLDDIAERYNLFWRRHDMEGSAMEYTVDHSSSMYLVDRHGEIRQRVLYAPTPHSLISAVRHELSGG